MRILFINCVTKTDYTCSMPLGVAYLVGYLKDKLSKKIFVKAVSKQSIKEVKKIIINYKPDIIGLSVTSPGYDNAKLIAKIAKSINKNIIIIAGGPHFSLFQEQIDPIIDYATIGESEQTFYELLCHLFPDLTNDKPIKNIKNIDGLIYWKNNKQYTTNQREFIKNLDSISHPERRLLNPTNNTIFTSRGCPFNCVYCSSPIIWRRKFRAHSSNYILKEIKTLYKQIHSVQWFGDDLFIYKKDRIRELIVLLKKEKLLGKISFIALGRSEIIDKELIRLLKKLNVIVIHFGFETGNNEILQYAKNSKNINVKQNIIASNLCRKYGILVQGYIMIGFPQDTNETINETYEFAKKYSDTGGKPNIVMVFPKTKLSEDLKKTTGKDYADIHLNSLKLTFGGDMPITKETMICQNLTPNELEAHRKRFHEYGIMKMRLFYTKLLLKLIFSKGVFLNMYYIFNIIMTSIRNPRREFVSDTIMI